MGIRETLGYSSTDEGWLSVGTHLRKFYLDNDGERRRRRRARLRGELYSDGGSEHMRELIRNVYTDPAVRHDREVWIEHARYDNALKRIVNELSTVYIEPAIRSVAERNDNYQRVQEVTRLDHVMRRANRWLTLHNDVLLWVRTREGISGERVPVVQALAPSVFYAISHPRDHTRLVAVVIDQTPHGVDVRPTDPHYLVYGSEEVFQLDANGQIIPSSMGENDYGEIPAILVHREPPDLRLLDATSGDDLVAAHVAAWFVDILLLKEARTVNKQVAFGGDLSTTPSGQTQDLGRDMHLGDGVTAQTIDRTIDLSQFRETADHIIERAAANYGIPPSVLRHAGATSGYEIELRRIGLRERRRDQIMVFRPAERELARILSVVLARDAPAFAFDVDGWQIDFGEIETPQDPMGRLLFREKARQMGLGNTLEYIMEDNPDLSAEAAAERLRANIEVETLRNVLMRELAAVNGSASQGVEESATPEQNGALADNAIASE